MKTCTRCRRQKPGAAFLAGKAKRPSTVCSTCRKAAQKKHIKQYFAKLSPDERHRLTHKKRAESYGVAHVAYSRTAILARWGYRCAYCPGPAEHLDHVIPLSRGGTDEEHNIVPACASCNLSKGAKSLAEWSLTFGAEPPPF